MEVDRIINELNMYFPKVIGHIVKMYAQCDICDSNNSNKSQEPLSVYCSLMDHKVYISNIETIKSFECVYLGDFKGLVSASKHLLDMDDTTKHLPDTIKTALNLKKLWKHHFSKWYHLEGTFLFMIPAYKLSQKNNNIY